MQGAPGRLSAPGAQPTSFGDLAVPGGIGADELAAAASFVADLDDHAAASGITILGAFVSGSVAVGLGNAASDIDLSVVVDALPSSGLGPQPLSAGRRIDVGYVTPRGLERMARRVRRLRVSRLDRRQLKLTKEALQASVRFATSIDLRPSPFITDLRASIDSADLRRILMAYAAGRMANCLEDTYGAVHDADWPTAVEASTEVVAEACELALACYGDLFVSPTHKFLSARLGRHERLASLRAPAWRLRHDAGTIPDARTPDAASRASAAVRSRLWFSGWLAGTCLVDGWDDGTPPPLGRPPRSAGQAGNGPQRNPFFGLMRFKEGLAMYGPDPGVGFDVSEETAKLWLLLDGSTVDTVIGRFARWSGLSVEELVAPVEQTVADLGKLGAVDVTG